MRPTMSRNASALQTTASTMTDTITAVDGTSVGHPPVNSTNGTYTTAVAASDTATTPTPGRSDIHRERIAGPSAYPTTTTAICATAMTSEPAMSRPTRAATPSMPRAMPSQL